MGKVNKKLKEKDRRLPIWGAAQKEGGCWVGGEWRALFSASQHLFTLFYNSSYSLCLLLHPSPISVSVIRAPTCSRSPAKVQSRPISDSLCLSMVTK
jgi:hypothetical protein